MVVDFAQKSLVGKARSRPDLVRQVIDKARREGLLTTLEAAFNRLDQPMSLGYSSAGTVVEVGEGLAGFQVGDRVACAGGGYAVHAEYAVVPQNLLVPLPDSVSFEEAAFATLGAIAMHGFRLANPQVGERVAVIGLGLLGLLTVGIARAAGCRVLGIDLAPDRVARGAAAGAEAVLRGEAEEAARVFSQGRGVDSIFICADTPSNDPIQLAGEIARDKAHVIAVGAVGLEIPRRLYFQKELTFLASRSYGPGRYDPGYEEGGRDYPIGYVRWTEGRNIESIIDLIADQRLDVKPLITHRFSIENAPDAYELITGSGQEPFLGVLLTYPGAEQPTEPEKQVHFHAATQDSGIRLGVLGAGNFATAVLLPAIRKIPDIHLAGVVSASGLSASHAAKKFKAGYAASDPGKLMSDPAVNTLAVLTRHHLHARQITAGLQAGKHVFCEKPLAIHAEELDEIQAALEEASTLLMVGYNRRFAPLSTLLMEFLKDRQEPLYVNYRVNAGFLPADHWLHDPEQGGGRLIGEGCHFIDYLTFLVGAVPTSVSAVRLPNAGTYQDDNFQLTFTFLDGSIGTLAYLANGDKSFPKERVEVFTGGKVAVLDDFRSLSRYSQGRQSTERSRLRQDKGHQAEWVAFQQAVLAGEGPPIPYNQLFGVARAAFSAVKALQSGKAEPVA
jgi:predicted dehydrogenase/threonine dehydrogenase-like Zn-dependent dehydrogenase